VGTPKRVVFPVGRAPSPVSRWSYALWAVIGAGLPAAAGSLARLRAIDLAYHVRAGEAMLRSGHLIRTDPFTFTVRGHLWLNQQWGAQILFASAHRLLRWAGVAATYAIALGAGFAFLYRSCRRAGSRPKAAALLTLGGFVVGASALGARPQALAIPLFTASWLLLSRRDAWSWLAPILAIVWANVHGSFVLAPLLAVLTFGEDLVERRPAARSGILALATGAATLVTPFGPAVWSYALDVVRDQTIRTTVAEWRPPSPVSASGGLFWISGLVVLTIAWSRRDRVRALDVVRLVVFFALGATALRSIVWWALAAPPVVAGWLASHDDEGTDDDSVHDPRSTVPRLVAAVFVLALIPIGFLVRAGVDPVTGAPARLGADAPELLVRATRRALPAGSRLLVFQPFASWFEYSLPSDPVMVDSRIELFPDRVWRAYDRTIVAMPGWEAVLDRFRIAGVVLPPRASLADQLAAIPGWRLAARNAAGSVFVRSGRLGPP
jgi:hypothetical protein